MFYNDDDDGGSTHLWNVDLLQWDYTSQKAVIFMFYAVFWNKIIKNLWCATQIFAIKTNSIKICCLQTNTVTPIDSPVFDQQNIISWNLLHVTGFIQLLFPVYDLPKFFPTNRD
jgi:hypothetical protein